jgi:circadian clock protein KaiC
VPTLRGRAAFGVAGLDASIGGGIPIGDSLLVAGPSGVGKTLLALQWVNAGLRAGEHCLYLTFQEDPGRLRDKAAAAGIDWSNGADELLTIRHAAPVELDLDEVGALLQDALADGNVKRMVVDSIDELGFAARDNARLPGYLWGVAGFARAAGGTTLFTNELAALGGGRGLADLSFILYDVFLLRYIEIGSEVRRGLSVLKMRQSDHTKHLHEFTIGDDGIRLGQPFEGVSGLLGWSALSGSEP